MSQSINVTMLRGNLGDCGAAAAESYRSECERELRAEYPSARLSVSLQGAEGVSPRPICDGFSDDERTETEVAFLIERVWERGDWHNS